ncbi:MAG: hypothetical protein ACRC8A_13300 [Microcoleaceae cyanobacterium]
MTFAVAAKLLSSRVVRATVTGNARGVRQLQRSTGGKLAQGGKSGGIFKGLGNFISRVLKQVAGGISWSFTTLWNWISGAVSALWNFNWDISDTTIDTQIQAMWTSVGGALGGLAGQLVGWTVCGFVPAAAIFTFNEAIGIHLLKELGEEAVDELAGAAANVIQISARTLIQASLLWTYKNVRRALKNPNNVVGRSLRKFFGDEKMSQWGDEDQQDWSFSRKLQNRIESIKSEWWQEFFEEFFDEAFDACNEAGYALAGGMDSWYAQQAELKASGLLGAERTIEVYPNRGDKSERLVLHGPEKLLRGAVSQTLANAQLLNNRDIGLYSFLTPEWMAAQDDDLKVIIEFYSVQGKGSLTAQARKTATRSYITIPNVSRSKCSWSDIKLAAGGSNGFLWGPWSCTAHLKGGRNIRVNAGTEKEGEQLLTQLSLLSENEIDWERDPPITLNKKGGTERSTRSKQQKTVKVYPWAFVLLNTKKLRKYQERKLLGALPPNTLDPALEKVRIHLYDDMEPAKAKNQIAQVLRNTL